MRHVEALELRRHLSATLVDGTLTITGTDAGERIYVERAYTGRLRAAIDRTSLGLFKADQVLRIVIDARGGDDVVFIHDELTMLTTLLGGAGDDYLGGGYGNDFLHGGPGADELNGNPGRDTLVGGSGDDRLLGGPDRDIMNGSIGNDSAVRVGKDVIDLVESVGPPHWYAPVSGMPFPMSVTFLQQEGSVTALIDVTFNDSGSRLEISPIRHRVGQLIIPVQTQRVMGDLGVLPAITTVRYAVPLGHLDPDSHTVVIMSRDGQFTLRKDLTVDT